MTTKNRWMLCVMTALALAPACGDEASDQAAADWSARSISAEPDHGAEERAAKIERGRYLVTAGLCNDCHTPLKVGPNGPEPDGDRLLSGHPEQLVLPPAPELSGGAWIATASATMTAWNGPWGTTFTANLTPDPDTGLGRWTEQNFIETIRNGRRMGHGRLILPPMPVQLIATYTDEDLAAMFAYLQSLRPVKNKVPEPIAPVQTAAVAPPAPTTTMTRR